MMPSETKALCPACDREVLPGTIHCFRHAGGPKVGVYRVDQGQLLWATTGCKGSTERALAVLVDGEQVALRDVALVVSTRPAKLDIDYFVSSGDEVRTAEIPLPRVFDRLVEGAEVVDASRHTG